MWPTESDKKHGIAGQVLNSVYDLRKVVSLLRALI